MCKAKLIIDLLLPNMPKTHNWVCAKIWEFDSNRPTHNNKRRARCWALSSPALALGCKGPCCLCPICQFSGLTVLPLEALPQPAGYISSAWLGNNSTHSARCLGEIAPRASDFGRITMCCCAHITAPSSCSASGVLACSLPRNSRRLSIFLFCVSSFPNVWVL